MPSFIVKHAQALVSISPKDHSFVVESHFKEIFTLLDELRIKTNVMQNSAVSFSFCTDFDIDKVNSLKDRLSLNYDVKYNDRCELITVRYFEQETIDKLVDGREILLEQRTRTSAQLVVKQD